MGRTGDGEEMLTNEGAHSPIKSVSPNFPGKVVLKMGIFPRIPTPEAESFALHRHEWQGKHPGVTQYKIKIFGEKMEG